MDPKLIFARLNFSVIVSLLLCIVHLAFAVDVFSESELLAPFVLQGVGLPFMLLWYLLMLLICAITSVTYYGRCSDNSIITRISYYVSFLCICSCALMFAAAFYSVLFQVAVPSYLERLLEYLTFASVCFLCLIPVLSTTAICFYNQKFGSEVLCIILLSSGDIFYFGGLYRIAYSI